MTRVFATIVASAALLACSAGEAPPSTGTYTINFPSTAAAVATDQVQLLVFDIRKPEDRPTLCLDLITARKRGDTLRPSVNPPAAPVNICELSAGKKPIQIPYGDKAILAIAQRKDRNDQLQDFMLGCIIQTIGDGPAPEPISMSIISVAQPVPDTQCGSVSEFCQGRCQ